MVKLNLRSPLVIAGVSFLLIWYAVMHQRVNSREHLTDVKPIPYESRASIIRYVLLKVLFPERAEQIKLTPEDKKFIAFLEANPITAVDEKMMAKVIEMIKKVTTNDTVMTELLNNPTLAKNGVRALGQAGVAGIIFLYADRYEKLKEPPTQDQFKAQMNSLFLDDPVYKEGIKAIRNNLDNEDIFKQQIADGAQQLARLDQQVNNAPAFVRPMVQHSVNLQKKQIQYRIDDNKGALDRVAIQKSVLGVNTYPFGASTSPLINQIFEIAYKYYFGETYTGAGLLSGAWKAIIGIFGSLGAIAIVGLIVYFVFLR
jgi:hypothetical protein